MKTVADQFDETLAAAGVKRIYGIVGDSVNDLTDAIRRQGRIEWVHVALGFVELEQKSAGFLEFGTEVDNPNFAAMAAAIGIRGIRLTKPADVDEAMADALGHDGPVLVDATVARTELAVPPSITVEMVKGFSLYMLKAIMSGRTDEIIDLAKTNLWR
jgi:pyruvate dehydrogenase (quinone)